MSEDTTNQAPVIDAATIESGVAAGLAAAGHPGTATVTAVPGGHSVIFTRTDGMESDVNATLATGFEHRAEEFVAFAVSEISSWFKKADAAALPASTSAIAAVSDTAEVAAPTAPSNAEAKSVMAQIEGQLQHLDLLPTATATWFKNKLAELKSKL
jgi:hypothetical protein